MNKIFRLLSGLMLGAMAATSCQPDEFDGASQAGLPTMSGVDFEMTVDQETNQMTARLAATQGLYPVWLINGTTYSTLYEVGYSNPEAGTYSIELRLGNRNGISQGSIVKTFTFDETKVDWTADFKRITGKEWRIASKEKAHLGCGQLGTDGAGWWAAGADEKKDFGLYDDRFTFTADTRTGGAYTYSPGDDGLTYINKGVTLWGGAHDEDADVEIGAQTSTWNFETGSWTDADGNVSQANYLVLAPNTAFAYVSSDNQYADPRFRIESLAAKKMVLVYDDAANSIAWRFILTNGEDEEPSGDKPAMDWNAASAANLWAPVEDGSALTEVTQWFANNDWSQIADAAYTHEAGTWTLTIPEGIGTQQWQGQFAIATTVGASAARKYNFYCLLKADSDCPGVTVKLTDAADDNNYLCADRHELKADEAYVYKLEAAALPVADAAALKLVLDFGGSPAGANVCISDIYLEEATVMSYDDEGNLWRQADASPDISQWFANNDWSQIADAAYTHEAGAWTLTIPEGIGTQQWQGQFAMNTTIAATMAGSYNFSCTLTADSDCQGVTIKLTDAADDNNFFFADRHDLKADEAYVYTVKGATLPVADAAALKLVLDFGGTPAGTQVTISDIILEKAE